MGEKVSATIRRALEEIRRREEQEMERALARAQKILRKIPPEELLEAVRSGREED